MTCNQNIFIVDEIENLKPKNKPPSIVRMQIKILTQIVHKEIRQIQLKTWVFATSNGGIEFT